MHHDVTIDAHTTLTAWLAHAALRSRALHVPTRCIAIGAITLLPHQVAAVEWLLARLTRYRGALLADPPGLGKTYVALAIAARLGGPTLVIAPAALRPRWLGAMRETGVPCTFVSTERLSAPQALPVCHASLVIIDEAHHLRTAGTRRYARAQTLCAAATVLLLSATPIHNRRTDLHDVLALVHAPPVRLTTAQLRRALTLRRTLREVATLPQPMPGPAVHLPRVIERRTAPAHAQRHAVVDAIQRLPALSDTGGDPAHALLMRGLLHAFASSAAALAARIRHRTAVLVAIDAAVGAGIDPSPTLRAAFSSGDDAVQLAMPALLGVPAMAADRALADRARRQRDALSALLRLLHADADAARTTRLRRLARWCATPVVAFTQFEATAAACYRALRWHPGIARLSGRGAEIASGPVTREEVLQRLLDARYAATQHRVRLLITTDVLSEGLSLAGVATIVHLDRPWTPARLDQRVGRAARIGAPVTTVRVLHCPACVPPSLHEEHARRLQRKRRAMHALAPDSDAATAGLLHALTARSTGAQPVVRALAVASSHVTQVRRVALVRLGGRRQLVVLDGRRLRAADASDWEALHAATPAPWPRGHIAACRRALRRVSADRSLTARVADQRDERLRQRIAGDEALLRERWRGAMTTAAHATALRRQLHQARDRRAGTLAAEGVRIYAMIVVIPAAAVRADSEAGHR
jgi:superfamily II DNA or RNA helicase